MHNIRMLGGNLSFHIRDIAMFKTFFAAAALLAVPTAAIADESFIYQGVNYTYTVETKGDLRILRGSADQGARPFVLKVSKSDVSGTFNGNQVEFSLKDVKPLAGKVLAVR